MRPFYVLLLLISYILLLPACLTCRLGANGTAETPGASASGDELLGVERGETRQEAIRLE